MTPAVQKRLKLLWRITYRSLIAMTIMAVIGFVALLVMLNRYGRDLPDYEQLAVYEPPVITHIHAGDGSLLTEFARERRLFVPLNVMPPRLLEAFLSAEDKSFYEHHGLDYLGIMRAAVTNIGNTISGRRVVGASTITQQVARNFLLTNEVSYERKIKEAILALRIERAFTKEQILELYLNEIYLGQGAYGVASASLVYFNKALDELTLAEMAYLAAIPKGPNNYHPIRNRERATARRNWVLERMVANDYIDEATAEETKAEPLVPQSMSEAQIFRAEYFLEEVRRHIHTQYGARGLYESGLSVHTTLEPRLQAIAEGALRRGLIDYDRRHGWRGALAHITLSDSWAEQLAKLERPLALPAWRMAVVLKADEEQARIGFSDGETGVIPLEEVKWARSWRPGEYLGTKIETVTAVLKPGAVIIVERTKGEGALYSLQQIPAIDGALVAMDPHTGRVLAMVGGFDFRASEFNRATQALRQPGSAFKPFVYAAALEAGLTPSTLVLDARFALDQGDGQGIWAPRNSTNQFYGPSTLRLGLELSRNLMTVRLAQAIGMERVADVASRFDIDQNMRRTLAMSLGAGEVTPLKLTTAYAMLANGGKKITPTLIDRIQDRRGAVIYRHDPRECAGCTDVAWMGQDVPPLPDERAQVMDPRTAYQVVHMLEGVIQRGTGRRVGTLGRSLAGKTGTTNDSRDAWFIGFSPDLVVGVFTGFDQARSLGDNEEGSSIAAPIFRDFMEAALKGTPDVPFRIPSGIRLVRVNAKTGVPPLPGENGETILEAFKPGTEPKPGQLQTLDDSDVLVQTERAMPRELGGIY